MKLTSPAFENGEDIPLKYTCDGDDVSPPLDIEGIPDNARSLALVLEDPDSPSGRFIHWVVYDIPPTNAIAEAAVAGKQLTNSFGQSSYNGPCPSTGTHRYFFKLYALDTANLDLNKGGESELARAMKNHIVDTAELMGRYAIPK